MTYGSLARRSFQCCLALAVLIVASGCASVTGSTNQSVSIQTIEKDGKEVSAAQCELNNSKGKWFITTPGSSVISRSNDDMQVICTKKGHEPGRASVVSAVKGSMFGNIILGGGIGAIVDHNTGAAYEYPSFFQVMMGTITRVEPPSQNDAQTQPPPAASGQTQPTSTSAPPVAPAARTDSDLQANHSAEDRLKELKRLHDAGLIDTNIYLEQQRKIMDSQP